MRISDWSSDVCSSDLSGPAPCPLKDRWIGSSGSPEIAGGLPPASPLPSRQPGERRLRGGRRDVLEADRATVAVGGQPAEEARSEERRVGKECVSTCRSRWSTYP